MKNIVILSLVLFLSACATSVNVDYQLGTDFSALKSFRIEETPIAVAKDPRVNNPFIQKRIIEALNAQLNLKGLVAKKDKPDVIVKYHLGIKQELESDDSGVAFGIGTSSSHSAFGIMFGSGTGVASVDNLLITIDLVKSETKKLLWRGSFDRRLAAGITPESSTQLINNMVKEILDKFPPKQP